MTRYIVRCRLKLETLIFDQRIEYAFHQFYVYHPDPVSVKQYAQRYYNEYAIVHDSHIMKIFPLNEP